MSNFFFKAVILIFIFIPCSIIYSQKYKAEFSTAGFYQTNPKARKAVNFNIGWRFLKKHAEGAENPNFDDKDWDVVNLPHGLELLPLSASGGLNYQGPAWYRKHFTPDLDHKGKKVFLHFEGIMGKSKIWINGFLLKEHFGGYFPAHVDISDHINFGEKNIVAVLADNSNDNSYPPGKRQEQLDFTYFGGIYRDVWMVFNNEIYITNSLGVDKIAGGGVFVHYQELSEKSVHIHVDTDIANDGKSKKVFLELKLLSKSGEEVGSTITEVNLMANKSAKVSASMDLKNPELWRPDAPYLYDLLLTIKQENGEILDDFKKRIGIRLIEMKGQDGLFLNGKPYNKKLIGANRHQDFAHIGHALSNNQHYRDALKLRRLGMRVIRSAHFVQDPAFMDACDELGLFTVVTIPGWQYWNKKDTIFQQRMLKDVRKLVRLERNRPSVLLWEMVPNETHYPEEFAIKSSTATKEEYPYAGNYIVCNARTHRVQSQKYFDVLYNNDIDLNFKNKSIFKREWGDFVDNWVDHNSISRVAKQWGEIPQLKQAMHYFKEEWTEDGELKDWPSLTKIFKASNSLIGATMWHPFDHQRGYHPDPFWGGIMDAYRQPKFSYFMMKSLIPTNGLENVPNVNAEPFVYIAHLLSPFSPEDITVFTNCDEVKLTMYGKEIGVKKSTDINNPVPRVPVVFKDVFRYEDIRNKNKKDYGKINQPYAEASIVKAEGLIDGNVVTDHLIWPVGRKRRLVLKLDDSGLQPIADGSDITTVVAYLVDAGGAIKRLSDEYVKFTVKGEGTLIEGDDIGINPQKLIWGEAVALVQSSSSAGNIIVKAELLNDGINSPDFAKIEFSTIKSTYELLYNDLPKKIVNDAKPNLNNEIQKMESLRIELSKTKKRLLQYELNKVGKQQQNFIE
jgi:beta-galactosidase